MLFRSFRLMAAIIRRITLTYRDGSTKLQLGKPNMLFDKFMFKPALQTSSLELGSIETTEAVTPKIYELQLYGYMSQAGGA